MITSALSATSATHATELICPQCDYDLRELTTDRCPECGNVFSPASAAMGSIPWSHRRRLGHWGAYWRTVVLATFAPAKFGAMSAAPVSYRDANRFRLITVAIASAGPAIGMIILLYASGGTSGVFPADKLPINDLRTNAHLLDFAFAWSGGLQLWPTSIVSIVFFFLAISWTSAPWFDRRALSILQRNRAVAISQYTCGPLAWTPMPCAIIGLMALGDTQGWLPASVLSVMGFTVSLIVLAKLILMWVNTGKLLRLSADAPIRRRVAAMIVLPISWYAALMAAMFIIPWLIGFFWLMIDSLI